MDNLTEEKRQKVIDSSNIMMERNIYSNGLRIYALEPFLDGKYYSDQSSFVCACFRSAGYDIPWMNVYAFRQSDLFETITVSDYNDIINKAKLADIIIFKSNMGIISSIRDKHVNIRIHQKEKNIPMTMSLSSIMKYKTKVVLKRFREFI